MRVSTIVLGALLASAASVSAQPTPAATTATPSKLDGYLMKWEQKMREVGTLTASLARIDKDKSFGSTTKFSGYAQYMKAGTGSTALNLALLELKQEGKTEVADKFVCTGTYLYQFLPAQKEIRAYEMPKPKPGGSGVGEDSFLGFLFGMKAEEAKRRYVLTLAKEDTWYVYVDVVPRFPADKSEFSRARLVLNKDSYLPRQLWFEHANGNEITWDIPRVQSGVSLDRRQFDAPRLPAGWKMVPGTKVSSAAPGSGAPSNPPPRVIRPTKPTE